MTLAKPKAKFCFGICLIFIFFFTDRSFAQIYAGGNGDGFSVSNFVQADNPLLNIYSGGNSSGFSIGCFAQAANVLYDIYKGGNEDGFSTSCFAQADNVLFDIYKGGNDDGFSLSCFAQADNVLFDIYKGGNEDGFSVNCFVQASNILYDIYNGGNGDGFSKFCLGTLSEVPLPVELLNFDGKYEDHQVLLQWKTASEVNNDYFVLERSGSGKDFIPIYKADGAGTSTQPHSYSFADEGPLQGINYYRLRQVDYDRVFTYSGIISVYAEDGTKAAINIFPNPSDNNEIVQILVKGVQAGSPVALTITNIYGEVVGSFDAATDKKGQIIVPEAFTSGLISGVYLVSVKYNTGQLVGKWVIK